MLHSTSDSAIMHPTSTMLKIPTEINERILMLSDAPAVAAMSQSCSFFRDLIHRPVDQHLWRSLFLARFDDPRTYLALDGEDSTKYPWATILQRRIRCENLLTRCGGFESLNSDQRHIALETLGDTVQNAPPAYSLKGHSSLDIQWVQKLITAANILSDLECTQGTEQDRENELELFARLHVLCGLTAEEKQLPAAQSMRTASRSFVYDLRKYARDNIWGPFRRNSHGKAVSWIHIDHIIKVISMNLEDIVELWDEMRPSTGLLAARPYSAPGMDSRRDIDWAGIEGKWYRYVCFMDYRDLFAFNFSTSTDSGTESLDASIFDEDDFQEAIRLIELNLRIISVSPCASHPSRPILRFGGSSKGAHGNEARVEGSVVMTPDGQVRWKFVSVYDGETQWSSEGIQVGGVGSATGVVGTWTGAFHSERDPVGPFWLWKMNTTNTEVTTHPAIM